MTSQKNTISPPVIYFDATVRRREKMRLASIRRGKKATIDPPSNDFDSELPLASTTPLANAESQDASECLDQVSRSGVVRSGVEERVDLSGQPLVARDPARPKNSFEYSEDAEGSSVKTAMIPTEIEVVPDVNADNQLMAIDPDDLTDFMINYVVEQTGYPTDMVEPDADLEADLGIDSITLALMLGAIRDRYGVMPKGDLSLDDFVTLNHIKDIFMRASSERIEASSERNGASLPSQS